MSRHLDVKLIRETLTALLLALIADSIAGYIMNRYIEIFRLIPGLLMIVPALIDMRGNIYGAFIARLSSKLHLGEIKNLRDKKVRIGVKSAQSLAYSTALVVGIFAGTFAFLSTGKLIYVLFIPAIILTTNFFTTSILSPLTAFIGIKSYQRGWNPDNVGVPLISSIGDLVSVLFIIAVGYIFLFIFHIPILIVGILSAILLYLLFLGKKVLKDGEGRKVYIQSMPILLLIAFLELITGGLWETNKIGIILLILPPTLETLGNIGSVYSSRLSSFIYLGFVEPSSVLRGKYIRKEIFSIFILSVIVYSLISIFVFGISRSLKSIFMIWSSAFLSIFLILIISYYLTVGCLRLKLDPDNVVVPIITTLADIIGTISIILFYTLIF